MRSILCGVVISALLIGGLEYAYRRTGGVPSLVPGKTVFELQYRLQQTKADRVVYVIGDSRVDWGFGDRLFSRYIRKIMNADIQAVNAGLSAGSTRDIMNFIVKNHPNPKPGILIINFSPASFYHFKTEFGGFVSHIKRQDILDHRIANYLAEKIYTFGQKWRALYRHFQEYRRYGFRVQFGWFSRTLFPEGFVNAKGRNNDGTENIPDPAYYRKLFMRIVKNLEYYMHRKKRTLRAIRRAKEAGWQVLMIRMPIGEEMALIESKLPDELLPVEIAHEAGLFFKDYEADPRTADLPSDGSHLYPESARIMSKILAEDVSRWIKTGRIGTPSFRKAKKRGQEGILVRHAKLYDKSDIFDVHRASIQNLIRTGLYSERAIQKWLSSVTMKSYTRLFFRREVLVATQDGEVVGFGQLDPKKKAIDSLHVLPVPYGYAIRSKLLEGLEKLALQKKMRKITLFASVDMISFYEHKNYTLESIQKIRFPNGIQFEYAVMKKSLP